MWALHCCFLGEVRSTSADGSATERRVSQSTCAASEPIVPYAAPYSDVNTCKETAEGFIGVGNQGGYADNCFTQKANPTVAVDVSTSVETSRLPPRWSDFGTRPELEAFLPSPFLSANCGSFSQLLQLPDSINTDNVATPGVYSVGLLGVAFSNGGGRKPPPGDLQCSTIAQLIGAVSSASWVGQGAQGAVVKAQWRSGCTVAVKWLVTDALNVPAAFMEALLAKMLAHPFLVQTFDCAICRLDNTFYEIAMSSADDMASSSSPARSGRTACPSAPAKSRIQAATTHYDEEQLAVVDAIDSFEGTPAGHLGPRPVECLEVLKQLGAAPGKYVVQIVSEWCDEGTLHSAIRRGMFRTQSPGPGMVGRSRTWALRALLRTAREVAQGMCHLHSLNIIHGDLKPGNVLLKSSRIDSRGFVAKVADFGLSRLCNQREQFVATADWGTVPYMAGEYLDNRLCKSSDVYSFGVLLWQMYTGKAPFAGHLEAQVAVGVMLGNLRLEWPPNMPPPLLRLGQACCRHEPHQRPTFKEVVVALVGIEAHVREVAVGVKVCRSLSLASSSLPASHSHQHQQQKAPYICTLYPEDGGGSGSAVAKPATLQSPHPARRRSGKMSPLLLLSPPQRQYHDVAVHTTMCSDGGSSAGGLRQVGAGVAETSCVSGVLAAGTPVSYSARQPICPLEHHPGGVVVEAGGLESVTSAIETSLSGCGLLIGEGTGGYGINASPSYHVTDSTPTAQLLASYPSNRQLQQERHNNLQHFHPQPHPDPQHLQQQCQQQHQQRYQEQYLSQSPLGQSRESTVVPQHNNFTHNASLAATLPERMSAASIQTLPVGLGVSQLGPGTEAAAAAASKAEPKAKRDVMSAAVEAEAGELWHADTEEDPEEGALAATTGQEDYSAGGVDSTLSAAAEVEAASNTCNDTCDATSAGSAAAAATTGGGPSSIMASSVASSSLAMGNATPTTIMYWSGGSSSPFIPVSTSLLGTGNVHVCSGALMRSLHLPTDEGLAPAGTTAAAAAMASMGASVNRSSSSGDGGGGSGGGGSSRWAPRPSMVSHLAGPRLLSNVTVSRSRGADGMQSTYSPPLMDVYRRFPHPYPYMHPPVSENNSKVCRSVWGVVSRGCGSGRDGGGSGDCYPMASRSSTGGESVSGSSNYSTLSGTAAVTRLCGPHLGSGRGRLSGESFAAFAPTATAVGASMDIPQPKDGRSVSTASGRGSGGGSGGGGNSAGSPGLRRSYIRSTSGSLMPMVAASPPTLQLRAMSSRRASAGPALQHVPEDDDLEGTPVMEYRIDKGPQPTRGGQGHVRAMPP